MKTRVMLIVCVMLIAGTLPATSFARLGPVDRAMRTSPDAVLAWNAIAQQAAIQVARQFPQQAVVYVSFAQAFSRTSLSAASHKPARHR